MKKIKINSTSIFKYIYLAFFLGVLLITFNLYNFMNEYVYETFAVDQEFLSAQVKKTSEVINSEKFEEIKINLEKKLNKGSLKSTEIKNDTTVVVPQEPFHDTDEQAIISEQIIQ